MADTTNRIAGVAYLNVDGVTYLLAGDFEYSVSTIKRTTLTGQDRVHGYSEMPVSGHIAGQLRDAGSLSLASINQMSNVTVTAELANGKTIIGRNMWTVDSQDVKTVEATFEVRWEGLDVSEA